jgi:hypothetical protein
VFLFQDWLVDNLFDQPRQHVVREMIHEVRHREEPFPAGRAAGHDNAGSTIRHAWPFGEKGIEAMTPQLGLQRTQKVRFLS